MKKISSRPESLALGLMAGLVASLLLPASAGAISYEVSNWVADLNGQTRAIAVSQSGTTTSFVNATNPASPASQFFGNSTIGAVPTTLTLASVGDQISLSGVATFNGGSPNGNTQWRLGLFYRDGRDQGGTEGLNWLGYFMGAGHNTASTFYERNDPNTGMYASGTGAVGAASGNNPGAVNLANVGYDLSFNVLRSGVNELQFNFSIVRQGGGYSSISSLITDSSPTTFAFDRVGMLSGSSLNATEIRYDNLTVTYTPVPEPSSLVLAALAWAGLVAFRRRAAA
jgi:hypothetical protein